MVYKNIKKAQFVKRQNRFVAQVLLSGETETVHVKNTGRCRELLLPGAAVYLEEGCGERRRTRYDLVAVEKGERLVNIDSSAPNEAVAEWIAGGLFSQSATVRREVFFGDSRFDFYVEDSGRRAFAEVKGVTLERDGHAFFPDAPTERGVKHVRHLISCVEQGYEAYIIFVIQMKGVRAFSPNDETDRQFGDALRLAAESGVRVLAMDSLVTAEGMTLDSSVRVML